MENKENMDMNGIQAQNKEVMKKSRYAKAVISRLESLKKAKMTKRIG
jgi:hypothetical protein